MKIPQFRFKDSFFLLLLYLITSQLCYSQNTDVKNSILTDKILVSAGIFNPIKEVKVSVEGSLPTTDIIDKDLDFDNGFNVNDFETTFALNFMWRFSKSNKWSLRAEYFKISNREQATLAEDIEWEDLIFKQGSSVTGGFGIALYKIFFGRTISRGDKHELGGGLGVHLLDVSAFIEGNAQINEDVFDFTKSEVSIVAPLPNIGFWYFYAPTEKWSLTARLDWFGIKIGDFGGSLWNISPGVNYNIFKNIGLGLSYKFFSVDVDVDKDEWKGNFNMTFSGPAFTINAFF